MCNSETVGLSRKQVGRAAVYSVDREQDPAAEAPAAWRGRKPEEEAKAAKARARAKAASKEEANHIFRCQCRASPRTTIIMSLMQSMRFTHPSHPADST